MNHCFCEHCIDKVYFRDLQAEMLLLGYECLIDPNGSGMMWQKTGTSVEGCSQSHFATCQGWDETPERFHRRAVRRAHAAQKDRS